MNVVAGVDVGNSTTEVVLGRVVDGRVEVLGAGRAPTRRAKGSPASLDGAADLVRRLARRHGVRVTAAAVAPLRPVTTTTVTVPETSVRTGRLRVVSSGSATAGGPGLGVGRPYAVGSAPPPEGRVVAVVPAGTGFRAAVDALGAVAASGRLAAVVLADDEAVLVANRLAVTVPVVDETDTAAALRAALVAVEVTERGRPLRTLADPLRLRDLLGLGPEELADAAALCTLLRDDGNAVVALDSAAAAPVEDEPGWLSLLGEGRCPLPVGLPMLRAGVVGDVTAYAGPPDLEEHAVDDLWAVDLAAASARVRARRAGVAGRPVGLATLHADAPYADPAPALADRLGVPVRLAASEAMAARDGALSTPGAPHDALVIDLGGGTIDAVAGDCSVVAAGGGMLLSVAVGATAGISPAAAEHVKRGPAHRVEAPQVLLAEDGTRSFLDRPAPADAVGHLVVDGPAGLLPFHRTLAPGEWRALRLQLKVDVLGANVARALRTLGVQPEAVVVVGGPAGDDEVLTAVAGALPPGTAVGRGDVGGAASNLGHRFAVAYGLLTAG